MAPILLVAGGVLLMLAFLLAFTVYGMAAAALGVVSVTIGALLLLRRRRSQLDDGRARARCR